MDYEIKKDGASVTARVNGKLTLDARDEFGDLLASLFEGGAKECVLDLAGVEFIDSTGLGMLLLAREKAQAAGASIALKGAQGDVLHSLSIAKIDALFAMQ